MTETVLFDYWRSSASYRVRIALNLAGIAYRTVSIDLVQAEQKSAEHLARNPQGLVPVLEIDGFRLTQSLAILDYLDQTRDMNLLPRGPETRARAQALAQAIAVDIHPVCNLQVVTYAAQVAGSGKGVRENWMQRFIRPGLEAFEALLGQFDQAPYCTGSTPGLADICLIPQLYNAERWGIETADLPRLFAAAEACSQLPSFAASHPDKVKPAG